MFKKRNKKISQNKVKGRKTPIRKRKYVKSRKVIKRKISDSFSLSVYSSIIIFAGFITLSSAIYLLTRQLQPVIKNERLKYLCTYQLGEKNIENFRDAKSKLEKLVGDSENYCKNFLLPKEKNKKRFRSFPIIKNIFLRFL